MQHTTPDHLTSLGTAAANAWSAIDLPLDPDEVNDSQSNPTINLPDRLDDTLSYSTTHLPLDIETWRSDVSNQPPLNLSTLSPPALVPHPQDDANAYHNPSEPFMAIRSAAEEVLRSVTPSLRVADFEQEELGWTEPPWPLPEEQRVNDIGDSASVWSEFANESA